MGGIDLQGKWGCYDLVEQEDRENCSALATEAILPTAEYINQTEAVFFGAFALYFASEATKMLEVKGGRISRKRAHNKTPGLLKLVTSCSLCCGNLLYSSFCALGLGLGFEPVSSLGKLATAGLCIGTISQFIGIACVGGSFLHVFCASTGFTSQTPAVSNLAIILIPAGLVAITTLVCSIAEFGKFVEAAFILRVFLGGSLFPVLGYTYLLQKYGLGLVRVMRTAGANLSSSALDSKEHDPVQRAATKLHHYTWFMLLFSSACLVMFSICALTTVLNHVFAGVVLLWWNKKRKIRAARKASLAMSAKSHANTAVCADGDYTVNSSETSSISAFVVNSNTATT